MSLHISSYFFMFPSYFFMKFFFRRNVRPFRLFFISLFVYGGGEGLKHFRYTSGVKIFVGLPKDMKKKKYVEIMWFWELEERSEVRLLSSYIDALRLGKIPCSSSI